MAANSPRLSGAPTDCARPTGAVYRARRLCLVRAGARLLDPAVTPGEASLRLGSAPSRKAVAGAVPDAPPGASPAASLPGEGAVLNDRFPSSSTGSALGCSRLGRYVGGGLRPVVGRASVATMGRSGSRVVIEFLDDCAFAGRSWAYGAADEAECVHEAYVRFVDAYASGFSTAPSSRR
jgi:hypothetical protein